MISCKQLMKILRFILILKNGGYKRDLLIPSYLLIELEVYTHRPEFSLILSLFVREKILIVLWHPSFGEDICPLDK